MPQLLESLKDSQVEIHAPYSWIDPVWDCAVALHPHDVRHLSACSGASKKLQLNLQSYAHTAWLVLAARPVYASKTIPHRAIFAIYDLLKEFSISFNY